MDAVLEKHVGDRPGLQKLPQAISSRQTPRAALLDQAAQAINVEKREEAIER
jgi:uncharacterized protein YccT (UPF0319 family)